MSEILLNAKDLKPVVLGLGKVVSRKSTLPVLEHIRIARDNNCVTLQATDLDAWATYRLQQPGAPVSFLVPFETLSKIVKALKGDALITLSQGKEGGRLVYQVGNSHVEVKLKAMGKDEWPAEPKVEGLAIPLAENFKPALKEALECASTDSSRYVLNGVCLDVEGKDGHYVVSTDGRCLFAGNSFEFGLKASALIPSGKFIVWTGFAEDGAWNLVTAKIKDVPWLKITSDHWTLVSKQINGNYPNWRNCKPTPNSTWTRLTLPNAEVDSLLKNVPLLPGNDDMNEPLTIEVTADLVLLKGRAKDAKDWTSISVPDVKVTGKPVEISLNREYLIKALRFGLLDIDIQDPLTPLLFSSPGKTLVVMPVHGDAAKRQQTANAEDKKPQPATPAPSAAHTTEERTNMPRQTTPTPTAESNPHKEALEKVESLKGQLRLILGELNDLASHLKSAEKEKRSTEKEVANVRQTIRSLQGLKI